MPGNGAAGASYGDLLVTSLVVLGGVCIAAFVVVRVVGRFLATGRTRGAHLLDVVARLPLEPRRSLYVVEAAGKTLLVGTSEMGLSVLSELDGDEVRTRAALRPSFGDLVRSAWQRRQHTRAYAASGHEPVVMARDAAALVPQPHAPASVATEVAQPAAPAVGSAAPAVGSPVVDEGR
jgi:flagellar biogenesis protein FliO